MYVFLLDATVTRVLASVRSSPHEAREAESSSGTSHPRHGRTLRMTDLGQMSDSAPCDLWRPMRVSSSGRSTLAVATGNSLRTIVGWWR
jgi:hypothetical protein